MATDMAILAVEHQQETIRKLSNVAIVNDFE